MKKYLLFLNIHLQNRIKSYLLFALILLPCLVMGQTITPTKTVIKNPNSCSIIDVELKIQGANPVSRPLEVVLVIDVSGSMGNTISGDTNTPMDYAKDAATDFVNTFFLPANNPTNLNRLAIVTYATTGTLRQGLTLSSGKAGLLTIIDGLNANGNTNIQDGIVKADNELIANGTYNCTTARSIVLLTDGVANRTGTGGSSCTSGTGGTCIQSAITAATNAKTHTVSSVVYNTQIFSVGLFGGISGTDQSNSEYCLNNIQSGGAYFTESGANLSGIYTQIFTQLSWVAAQITGTPFEKETVSNDFNIVGGSISVSKGTFTQAGQVINWNVDFLNVETITLKYQVTPKANICGNQTVSTSRLDYRNSQCTNSSQDPSTPIYCVPCAPVLSTLPGPSTINCPATPNFTTPTVINGCVGSSLTFNDVRTNGNCAGSYSVTRTWTASNACFTATASQTINVQDVTAPVIDPLPGPSTINCPATPVFAQATATDACGSAFTLTFNDVRTNGNCAGSYSITRTWTAKDACNNTSTATQVINVQDITAPVINPLPGPSTINCPATPSFAQATASDACGSSFTLTYNDVRTEGNCVGSYSITRTWTAKDACNNTSTATQVINVQDVTAPVLSNAPQDITVECSTIPTAAVLTATDTCDPNPVVTFAETRNNGNCLSSYTLIRTWTAKDACGNTSTKSQTITVRDTTAPTFNGQLPADVTVQCSSVPAPAVITATDNCDQNVQVVYTETFSGQNDNCSANYVITRKWSVTDCAGNNRTHTQIVTVQDTTAPTFNGQLPADVTVQCSSVPAPAVITATDNCDQNVQVVYTETFAGQNDNCSANYVITRKWSVTDCAGNNTTHTQIVTVQDTTAPTFNGQLPADVTVQCSSVPAPAVITATDNCDQNVQVVYTETFAGQNDNCSANYVITRKWSVTDCAGNNTTHTQIVTVQDTTAPTFNGQLPADVTVQCSSVPAPAVITATDNCDQNVQVVYTETFAGQNDNCSANYVITRKWSVTD
ncbi:VWA domain-containing protein, partial [Flavobacterium amniphilum]|uniref:HYR-like domain-containing protein n=1 Tax=Flavobacterium amniphilum TaxID=1834035 RepID=UPI00202AA2DD